MKLLVLSSALLLASTVALAQQKEIPVKSTAAEDALVQQATQSAETSKAYNDLLQQARTNLDTKNKPILEEMKTRSAKWQTKIDADTKDLKGKLDENTKQATDQFQKEVSGLQARSVSPQTIKALEEVVKKEQSLPDNATFDVTKKVWTVPAGTPTAAVTPPPPAK